MKVEFVSEYEWKNLVESYPDATFFHTYEWYEVWKEYAGYNIYGAKITLTNEEIIFFPYAEISKAKGLIKKIVSSPMGTYGGPLGIDKSKAHLIHEITNLLVINNYEIIFFPDFNYNSEIAKKTFILEIQSDLSLIIEKWSRTNRKSLRKSLNLHREISFSAAESLSDWQQFYGIYYAFTQNKKRANAAKYNWSLLQSIYNFIPKENRILFVIRRNGDIIGGQLIFIYKNRAHFWIKTMTSTAKSMRLGPRLNYEITLYLKSKLVTKLDFGFSNNELSIENYKKSFGTNAKFIPVVSCKTLFYRIYQTYLSIRR